MSNDVYATIRLTQWKQFQKINFIANSFATLTTGCFGCGQPRYFSTATNNVYAVEICITAWK